MFVFVFVVVLFVAWFGFAGFGFPVAVGLFETRLLLSQSPNFWDHRRILPHSTKFSQFSFEKYCYSLDIECLSPKSHVLKNDPKLAVIN